MISIIIPAYNADKSIQKCVRSILEQDFKDLEIIVVDDGSNDSTATIVQGLALTDSRITLIHQQNSGQTAARAAGIRKASGEWVYFLDSDDALMPDAISSIYSHVADDIDVVVYESNLNAKMTRLDYLSELLSFKSWYVWGKLWRRKLFDEYVMGIPRYFRIGEDMLMQMRLLKNINNFILCVPQHKYIYDENSTTSVRRKVLQDYEYEKRVIQDVERSLAYIDIDDDATDSLRRWQLSYLAGMMGLKYNIDYEDDWILKVKEWARSAELSLKERLTVKAIYLPSLRQFFIFEKSAKRLARNSISTIRNIFLR